MDQLSFIPLGGAGDVTKNMYLYRYKDQIFIVDCGIGFPDETTLGADLFLPDISYLLSEIKNGKKIVGMALTHGHEDHIGALPFILPQLPFFPIFASPLTAYLAAGKLREFGLSNKVTAVEFTEGEKKLGDFKISLIRVTHSIPDTSHILIRTPVGNFYHGSDFKFDEAPEDGKKSNFEKIKKAGTEKITCLMSDCLGVEKEGRTGSELSLFANFLSEIKNCRGKFIVTTYSSHIARLNQIIEASKRTGRKICFVGRSLEKATEAAKNLGYLKLLPGQEVRLEEVKRYKDTELTYVVAGSQGQEESALARITNGGKKEIKLAKNDTVIFSSDPIPGNEVSIYELIDTIAKKSARVLYSPMSKKFHVSGHGSQEELRELISLTRPQKLIPIGGALRHMYLYRNFAEKLGYKREDVLLPEDGQEVIFEKGEANFGRLISAKKIYVDKISGEEIENFVLRDRQRLSEGGIVVILSEIDSENGRLIGKPDIIVKGVNLPGDSNRLEEKLFHDLRRVLGKKKERVINWIYIRNLVRQIAEKRIFKDLRLRPLVLPVVIEV